MRSDESLIFWLFDVASVVAFVALEIWGWAHLIVHSPLNGWLLTGIAAVALVLSWSLADLASGLVHFAADHFGSESTPLLGRFLIAPFRRHHEDPREMLEHRFFERNGNCALIALPAIFWIPLLQAPQSMATLASMTALLLGMWTLGTNQFHAWAHADVRPGWVTLLQNWGFILSPRHHQTHHTPYEVDQDTETTRSDHYCITHGKCEWLLRLLVRPLVKSWS